MRGIEDQIIARRKAVDGLEGMRTDRECRYAHNMQRVSHEIGRVEQ